MWTTGLHRGSDLGSCHLTSLLLGVTEAGLWPLGTQHSLPGTLGSEGLLALRYTPHGAGHFFFLLWAPLQLLGTASPGWMGQPENWWSIPTDKRSVARPLGSLPSGGAEAMFSQTCSLSQDGAWLSALSFRPRRKHLELGLWGRFGEARVLGQDCLPVVRSESGGCTLQTGPAWLGSTEGEAPHCHLQHPLSKAPRGMLSWKRVSSPY